MSLSTTQYGYIVDPMVPFTDDKGKTIKNGFIRVFMAGTSTPVLTYRNYDGATNQEKIELDNSGRVKHNVIGSKGSLYKVVVYNILHSQENPLLTVDKIAVLGASVTGTTVVTGLDSVTVQEENFLKATVEGTGVELAIDPTEVTSEVSTIGAAETAAPDYVVPLLEKTGTEDSKKISLANLFKFDLDWISRLATTITSFASGDFIAVSNTTIGARKMSKDTLLELTAQNALAGNVAPDFDPNSTTTVEGNLYVYNGSLYVAKEAYQGPWDASKFESVNLSDVFAKKTDVIESVFEKDYFTGKVEIGKYIALDGSLTVHSSWLTTTYLEVKYLYSVYVIPNPVVCSIAFYDADKNFISGITKSNEVMTLFENIQIPSNAVYFRACTNYSQHPESYVNYSWSKSIESVINDNVFAERLFKSSDNVGYLNLSGVLTSKSSWRTTDYYKVENLNSMYVIPNPIVCSIAFYDADKNFISGITKSNEVMTLFENIQIPSNAVYFRACTNYSQHPESYVKICWSVILGEEIPEPSPIVEKEAVNYISVFHDNFKASNSAWSELNGSGVWAFDYVNGTLTPSSVGGYHYSDGVSSYLYNCIGLAGLDYATDKRTASVVVTLYSDTIFNIHNYRSLTSGQLPNESLVEINCSAGKIRLHKNQSRAILESTYAAEGSITISGETKCLVVLKKLKEKLSISVHNYKTMALLGTCEIENSWTGGTFIGKYAFSYGGGTAPVIHSFDVSCINRPSVCFVGDSITEGYGASVPSKGYAHILRDLKDDAVISAESSDTVSSVVGRFTSEFNFIKPKIIFALIGTNNSTTPFTLYDGLISAAESIGASLVLNYIPTGYDVDGKNALIATKNKIGVHFEEISYTSGGTIDTSLFPDSVHPNDAGAQKMAARTLIECGAMFKE